VTKGVLPTFEDQTNNARKSKGFALVYWSRDPDGTQHNEGDSLNSLTPGINGPTSKAAVQNADNNLKQLLDYLTNTDDPNNPGHKLIDPTDVVITADHGFATISRHDLDNSGSNFTTSYASSFTYKDATGRQEVNPGYLPPGFVALDIAHNLGLPLFDPDSQVTVNGVVQYKPVDPTVAQANTVVNGVQTLQHPANGDGLIGGTGKITPITQGGSSTGFPVSATPTDAQVVVAANGGSDLIYVSDAAPNKQQTVQNVANFLLHQDYISGVFVDDAYGNIPGTLPLSAINLKGTAQLSTPSIVINFRTFSTNPNNPNDTQAGVEIADTGLQQGQGMHGSFGRQDTFNFMAASGPDFKKGYVDAAPSSNADLPTTLA